MKRQDDQKLIDAFYTIMNEETALYRMSLEEQADWVLKESTIFTRDQLLESYAKRHDEIHRLIAKRIRSLCLDMMLQLAAHKALGGDYVKEQDLDDPVDGSGT